MPPGSANTTMRPNPETSFSSVKSLVTAVLLLWASCSYAQPILSTKKLSFADASKLNITLGYFSQKEIPDSLRGCSASYAFDTLSFRLQKMALYSNTGSTLILKINRQLIFFHIDRHTLQNKKEITEFSGHGYSGKLISQEIKKVEGTVKICGASLEIQRDGKKMVANLLGYVGC